MSVFRPLAAGLLIVSACATAPSTEPRSTGQLIDGEVDCAGVADQVCDQECAQPDVDCFLQFADQATAATWFGEFEKKVAAQELRPERTLLETSDPRFIAMRKQLDEGWQAYRQVFATGQLVQAPELVIINDEVPNAFVASDAPTQRVGWVVMVQTGLIDKTKDVSAIMGVVMHELEHAVRLHVLPGVSEKLRIHYQVFPSDPEPFGFEQTSDPIAKQAIEAWRDLAQESGLYPLAELNGLPVASPIATVFAAARQSGLTDNPEGCQAAVAAQQALDAFTIPKISGLDSILHVAAADLPTVDALSKAYIQTLRDDCLKDSTLEVTALIASHFGIPQEVVLAGFDAETLALIADKHVVDQITLLTADRYSRMRAVEAQLVLDTGGDMTTMRYFSTEEAADDATVPVLRTMGLEPSGIGAFFVGLLAESVQTECNALLAAGKTPPYGELVDEHHASCFRAFHVRALAANQPSPGRAPRRGRRENPDIYSELRGSKLPARPLQPSDYKTDCFRR